MLRQQYNAKNQISPQQAQPPSNQLLSLPDTNDDDATQGPGGRPPWWRRRGPIFSIALVLLIILLGGIFISFLNRPRAAVLQYQNVTQGDIALTVSATGPLQSATYNLVFVGASGSGKIDEMDVKVGDSVKAGQVLAKLDKTSLQDAVNQAQAGVKNAQASLNAALASAGATQGSSSANVNSAQTTLNNANSSLNQTQAVSSATIAADQASLNNAKAQLTSTKTVANAQIDSAKTQRDQALANCNNNATAVAVATATATAGGSTGTPGTSPVAAPTKIVDCTQAAQNQYNQTVAQANDSVLKAQQAVDNAQSALNQAQAQTSSSNTTAQNNVNSAQSGVNTAQSSANASNTGSQSQVTTAQGQLTNAQLQLEQAQHNLDNATLKAPHDGIISVVNGTIGGTPGVPASSSSTTGSGAGGSTFIQIVDTSVLQVQANINESDTANLKVGQPVTFTVNAYTDRQFKGTVSAISPVGQTVSNVVSYPVSIDVDMNNAKGANLLPNMTANVTITVVQHKNALLIPVNAINFARLASSGSTAASKTSPQLITRQQASTALGQAVLMLNNLKAQNPAIADSSPIPAFVIEKLGAQYIAKPVVLGLTDGTSYEVLTGLSAGETIIVGTQQGIVPGAGAAGKSGGGGGVRLGGGFIGGA